MYLSSVVLYELMAANIDDSTFKEYAYLKQVFGKSGKLLTPTATDWHECSKVIRNMLQGKRSRTTGRVAKVTSAQQQQNDALIARTACLSGCFVVTENVKDFERFQPYMKDLIVVPADYFFE